MDKGTLQIIDEAANNAVAKMREFHLDDLKVLGERMDIGFESIDRRFDALETRMDRVESAIQTLVHEMREDRNELKKQINELTLRVQILEKQLATAN